MPALELLPGTFIANCGLLRTGKTMNMVRIAQFAKVRGAMRVVTNFTCGFGDYRVRSEAELFDEKVVSNCILCLDEMQTITDSREFGKNVDLTKWLIWLGKLGVVLLYTTPKFGMVDVRLRQLTGWIYLCERRRIKGEWFTVAQLAYYGESMGDEAVGMGKTMFRQRDYWGVYDTLDRETALVSASPPKTARSRSA